MIIELFAAIVKDNPSIGYIAFYIVYGYIYFIYRWQHKFHALVKPDIWDYDYDTHQKNVLFSSIHIQITKYTAYHFLSSIDGGKSNLTFDFSKTNISNYQK